MMHLFGIGVFSLCLYSFTDIACIRLQVSEINIPSYNSPVILKSLDLKLGGNIFLIE